MFVPSSVEKNLNFLKNLAQTQNPQNFIEQASEQEILCLVEICFNLISYRYSLSRKQLNALRRFATQIRLLSKIRSFKKAKQLLKSLPPPFYNKIILPILQKL